MAVEALAGHRTSPAASATKVHLAGMEISRVPVRRMGNNVGLEHEHGPHPTRGTPSDAN
jgi:hypothetical protein